MPDPTKPYAETYAPARPRRRMFRPTPAPPYYSVGTAPIAGGVEVFEVGPDGVRRWLASFADAIEAAGYRKRQLAKPWRVPLDERAAS